MLNSKLYKIYYPITTDDDKAVFVGSNLTKIYRLLDEVTMFNMSNIMQIEHEYAKRFKKELSIFFKLKIESILHNNHVELEREHDDRLKSLKEDNVKYTELQERLFNNSLSIEDANAILCIYNINYRKNIRLAILGLLSSVALIIIMKIILF